MFQRIAAPKIPGKEACFKYVIGTDYLTTSHNRNIRNFTKL